MPEFVMRTDEHDPLDDFERRSFTLESKTREVYLKGSGPAVVVIHEVPGITPQVADFGRRVAERGMTAALPHLFGNPGEGLSVPYAASSLAWTCVAREFTTLGTGATSAVTVWLRALAKVLHDECGGPGVGAVGMCLTGGFALAMMVDDTVVAPVLSQPSLPVALGKGQRSALGISDADLDRVKERTASGACVLGLRFTHDRLVPGERFERLRQELGDAFLAVEIDSGPSNPDAIPRIAHSVLTNDLVDEPGHPTRAALDQVLDFFAERLGV